MRRHLLGAALLAAGALAACSVPVDRVDVEPLLSPGASESPVAHTGTETASPSPASPLPSLTPAAADADFYLWADSQAQLAWRRAIDDGRDADAALLEKIATTPTAVWFGSWSNKATVARSVDNIVGSATRAGEIPVIVLYSIPARDCGAYSAGGLTAEQYLPWMDEVAEGINGRETWVILEPDALANLGDCSGQGDRVGLLAGAAEILDAAGARVYLDAGNPNWQSADEMASRLDQVGGDHLAGFALNVSNFASAADNRAYGDKIAAATGLHYVVDTSRSGNGWNGEWCNPRGRALGPAPERFSTGALDAYLWIKAPGESDGECNGGLAAGAWWETYALELARNA